MSEKIKVYKKPTCVQCTAVLRTLDAAKVDYELIDLTQDEAAMDLVVNKLGYRQVPVVVYGDDHFPGFDPKRLGEVVEAFKASARAAVETVEPFEAPAAEAATPTMAA